MTRKVLVSALTLLGVAALSRWTNALDLVETKSSYEAAWLVLTAFTCCVGLLEGRWWVVLLSPVIWLAVWVPGLAADQRGYFLIFGVPAVALGFLTGVTARKAATAIRSGTQGRAH